MTSLPRAARRWSARCIVVSVVAPVGACSKPAPKSYLFVWVGDSAHAASDFLGVIDATPGSAQYGSIVASLPTGKAGTHPHHTEQGGPADDQLLANGFMAGSSFLVDVSNPLRPQVLAPR